MDYQTWLQAFSVELSHQWNGIVLDDLDSLHVQSLYHRGLGPVDAAHLKPVLKDLAPDIIVPPAHSSGAWKYVVAGVVALLALGYAWQRHIVGMDQQPSVELVKHTRAPIVSNVGGYNAEEVNYGTFEDFPAPKRRSVPYHSAVEPSSTSTGDLAGDDTPYVGVDAYLYGREDSEPSVNTNLPGSSALAVSRSAAASSSSANSSDNATPVIEQFTVTSLTRADTGFGGSVSWQVSNADQVEILLLDQPVVTTSSLTGSMPFTSVAIGETFTIRASKGGRTVEQAANVAGTAGN